MNAPPKQVFSIGHSTHPIGEFIGLLSLHGIELLADVRAFPGSRHQPQFNRETLERSLGEAGIHYHHMVSLGGRRKRQDVPKHDTHWRNPSFANYADYTKTQPFQEGLATLEDLAVKNRVAMMCAEALWWRCHRRIIADEMAKNGFSVTHIMSADHRRKTDRSPMLPGL